MTNAIIIISTLLTGLILGALSFLIITNRLRPFFSALGYQRTILLLQKDLGMKEQTLIELKSQTEVMQKELNELRHQNALLKATLAARDISIDSLSQKVDHQSDDIAMLKDYQERNNLALFRYLSTHSDVDMGELRLMLGILPPNPNHEKDIL